VAEHVDEREVVTWLELEGCQGDESVADRAARGVGDRCVLDDRKTGRTEKQRDAKCHLL
jgi:hypothetical protein